MVLYLQGYCKAVAAALAPAAQVLADLAGQVTGQEPLIPFFQR